MTRRHPHVFGSEEEREEGPVPGAWEQIKAAERAGKESAGDASALAGVPLALPALKRAQKVGERAAAVGFDWPDTQGVRAKIAEELAELSAAECSGQVADIEEEMGDLLFSVVNLARHLKVDPESALAAANRKFERRFRSMEAAILAENQQIAGLGIRALEDRWQQAKKKLIERG
jgi:MazG family protein